jgi:hypothetical protein
MQVCVVDYPPDNNTAENPLSTHLSRATVHCIACIHGGACCHTSCTVRGELGCRLQGTPLLLSCTPASLLRCRKHNCCHGHVHCWLPPPPTHTQSDACVSLLPDGGHLVSLIGIAYQLSVEREMFVGAVFTHDNQHVACGSTSTAQHRIYLWVNGGAHLVSVLEGEGGGGLQRCGRGAGRIPCRPSGQCPAAAAVLYVVCCAAS